MRLKLTYERAGGQPVNVAVTADATASVADVAAALLHADPTGARTAQGEATLLIAGAHGGALAPATPVLESGLTSGARVQVVAPGAAVPAEAATAAAMLRVLAGPDAGREFPLRSGTSVVGRAREADVVLSDPLVSKRHLRVNVGEAVEVHDLGSANGVTVAGAGVTRAVVQPGEEVALGDTVVAVLPRAATASPESSAAPVVDVIRSPRVVARFDGAEVPAPQPPKILEAQRFPYLAIVAPLVMGLVMFALTKQLIGVIMIALSPILVVGAWLDAKWTRSRGMRAQAEQFAASISAFRETMAARREREREVRQAEAPPVRETVDAILARGSLLWTRRPEHPAFLAPRLGLATLPSRDHVVLPTTNDTAPEHWRTLTDLRDDCALVDNVPLLADLRIDGSLGLAGEQEPRAAVARGVMLQLLGLHSPAELVCAAIVPPSLRGDWDWLEWMPHTASSHSPLQGDHLAASHPRASALLAQLEGLVDSRLEGKAAQPRGPLDLGREPEVAPPAIPAVVLLVEAGAPVDRARATRIAERGADVNVHVIWCARAVAALPAACRIHLDVSSRDGIVAGRVRTGGVTGDVAVEGVDAATADAVARALAAAVDAGVPESDESDLPRTVSLIDIGGAEALLEVEAVQERWRLADPTATLPDGSRRKAAGNLRAVVGHGGGGPLVLDLKEEGPHALVGGTTGSGKSEFLQSWVLGIAAAHSPERVTFLFVDYKGGAAFADCVKLPHSVGLVTDLSPHLVRRALTSLRAELRYREHLLQARRAKDLDELLKRGDTDAPPRLVIVVDEFAALVNEVPEFVDGVVDVAQRGRSLGLHLILATQRPAGVIKDNLRANTNLRVALRMADTEDSNDVLGDPVAAHFDPGIPGRGVVKKGPGRLTAFQSAYAGGHTGDEVPPPRIEVEELAFGSGAAWDVPEPPAVTVPDNTPTDLARVVHTLQESAHHAGIPEPRKPWMPELAQVYDLAKLPSPRTDQRLVLGVIDDPQAQAQPTVFYEPDEVGNLALLGAGGSGKSTALRTLAVSGGLTARGGPVQVYGLDFGGGALRMLEVLPHVGAIISGDDGERVVRLLRMLRGVVDERAARYSALAAATVSEYRAAANRPDEPRIVLLVDGMNAFRDAYEFSGDAAWFGVFSQLAVDGRQVGVHVVVTGDRPGSIPTALGSTFQQRVVLRCATPDDYVMLGVPKDVLDGDSAPGRAILGDGEMQVAVFGGQASMAAQAHELTRLAGAMRRQGVAEAPPIARMPEEVPLETLPAELDGLPAIGLLDETLAPAAMRASGLFMVTGAPASGRTSALVAIGRAVKRAREGTYVAVLAPRRSALTAAGGWDDAADTPAAAAELMGRLQSHVGSGRLAPGQLTILIENAGDFAGTEAEAPLAELAKAAARADQLVVGEAESSAWKQSYALAQLFQSARRGLVLAPGDMDGDMHFSTPLGRVRRADFPPGRGFLVEAGRARKVQIAWAL
ncbi:FtsK/SpoIIIE domain-containing protein [Demequina iriomotensis]|uniref:FtsK/SpoIIIE domain-containing protein n=1 Tax=Demequina iriomotensis TaxID=1536641 RepID=UPI0007844560|nr:FtsK/SpoIIIE domain-containing protein [Demequina iriomotensis]